ncbi:MAG TPA: TlpA family protein disulfide reductase [Tepidimicrobium sp.]|nr:TlpA family protein disulfide reductase [Tepidimicrobium sp.]
MRKTIGKIIDIILILLIVYLSFRLLQKKGIIDTRLDKLNSIPAFEVEDMEGNLVTEAIFEDHDFTIVNIWSPLCGACIEELIALRELEPHIQEKNGNVLGIITNGSIDMAKTKIDELGLRFTNLIPNRDMNRKLVKGAVVTPTTIFVDEKGHIIEKHTGSYGTEGDIRFLRKKIDELIRWRD